MGKKRVCHVYIPLDKDSEVFQRIQAYAQRTGLNLDVAVNSFVLTNVEAHLERNLDLMGQYAQKA